MKDIMTRLTKAEKTLITELRNYDIFTLKEIINDIGHLSAISKYTDKNIDADKILSFISGFYELEKEREEEALKKLKPRKQQPKTEIIERNIESLIENNEDQKKKTDNSETEMINRFKSRNFRNFLR